MSSTGLSPCEFDLPSGNYLIRASLQGHAAQEREISYDAEVGADVHFDLVSESTSVTPVAASSQAPGLIILIAGLGLVGLLLFRSRR